MVLSESKTGALVAENLSTIETELAKLEMVREEQRKATEALNEEFQETLSVLVSINSLLGRFRANRFNSIDTEKFH